jgi:hypothetical protein
MQFSVRDFLITYWFHGGFLFLFWVIGLEGERFDVGFG